MTGRVLVFFIAFLVVIGIHEWGHALAAKWFKVTIQRISFGFGRPLLTWKSKRGVEWVWALWPLGGYVQLLNSRIQPVTEESFPRCLDKQSLAKRAVIFLAGALANAILALLALTLVFMLGYKQYLPVVKQAVPGSIVAEAGILPGDKIVDINDQPVYSWQDAGMRFFALLGQASLRMGVQSPQGEKRLVTLDLTHWHLDRKQRQFLLSMGFSKSSLTAVPDNVAGVNPMHALLLAVERTVAILAFFFIILKQLALGVIPFSLLLGPIGFIDLVSQSFAQGLSAFLAFIATLSLSVGLVNLLPVPGLDGGSLVYLLIEKIRGKPISVALEILLYQLALIVFFIVLIQLLLNDLRA